MPENNDGKPREIKKGRADGKRGREARGGAEGVEWVICFYEIAVDTYEWVLCVSAADERRGGERGSQRRRGRDKMGEQEKTVWFFLTEKRASTRMSKWYEEMRAGSDKGRRGGWHHSVTLQPLLPLGPFVSPWPFFWFSDGSTDGSDGSVGGECPAGGDQQIIQDV